MKSLSEIRAHQLKLQSKYKRLIEQAYNFRQTDSALSDLSEFKAYKLLHKLNQLKFLNRETLKQASD
ncbi:MAG: Lacal_2735 family protein [Gelidibacter sp.]|nr:Lacal_2735 family protein [Gelidibacter sp.]